MPPSSRPPRRAPGGPPTGPRRASSGGSGPRGAGPRGAGPKGGEQRGRDGRPARKEPPRTKDGRPIRISRNPLDHSGPRPEPQDRWVDEGPAGAEPAPKPARRKTAGAVPEVDQAELRNQVGAKRAQVLAERITAAAGAFSRERFPDAQRILKPIAAEVPSSAVVRELYGLTLYRLGRYRSAAAELEAFRQLTNNSTEQHPVLADCYRALKRYRPIDELWTELREESPSAALVTEGRIVVAGSLADRGRLADAVRLLDKGWKPPRRPAEHHLRRAYALGDLLERAGDLPRARATFGWLAQADPSFGDVAERVAALR